MWILLFKIDVKYNSDWVLYQISNLAALIKSPLIDVPKYLATVKCNLKLVSTIFIKFLFFSPNDSPSKTMKNVFYFILKTLFVLKIFKFL